MPKRVDEEGNIYDSEESVSEITPTTVVIYDNPGLDPEVRANAEAVVKMSMHAAQLQVDSVGTEMEANDCLIAVKKMEKALTEAQKEWLKPVNEAASKIREKFGDVLNTLRVAKNNYEDKILAYRKLCEAEEAKLKAKIDALNEERGEDELLTIKKPLAHQRVKTTAGSSSTTTDRKWEWREGMSMEEIVKTLPSKFLMPNEKLISQCVRGKSPRFTEADFKNTIKIIEVEKLITRSK